MNTAAARPADAGAPARAPRVHWLDGLRGLAALQVVLLHYAGAFLPLAGRVDDVRHYGFEAWVAGTPLFFLINGHLAVQVFFLLSGMVLGQAFLANPAALPRLALLRFARLFVPALAAIVAALALAALLPLDRASLAAAVGSDWLGRYLNTPWNAWAIARDALADSILLGYRDVSLFDQGAEPPAWMASIAGAIVPPLWTLHIEFWGSMLVLLLAGVRRHAGPRGFVVGVALALLLTGTSHYTLFVIGMLMRKVPRDGSAWIAPAFAPTCIALGVVLSSLPALPGVPALASTLSTWTVLDADHAAQWQSQLAAIALVAGVAAAPPCRRLLERPALRALGRMSFGIYLLHFGILASVATQVFLLARPHGHGLATALALSTGLACTVAAAHGFERWVDRSVLAWTHRCSRRPLDRTRRTTARL